MEGRTREKAAGWLKLPLPLGSPDPDEPFDPVKPAGLIGLYEEILNDLRDCEFTLFELGIKRGDSLVMWRDAFPRATVIGLDLDPPEEQFGDRVHMWKGDQTDCQLLSRIRQQHAPDGFDVVIDDASHFGAESAASLRCIINQHIRPGGNYVIEDSYTGYTDWWRDGRSPRPSVFDAEEVGRTRRSLGKGERFPSHEFGLPGVVKQLLDQLAAPSVPWFSGGGQEKEMKIASMRVDPGAVVLVRDGSTQPKAEIEG
ncbi:MAG: hypothetical protein ACKOPI_03630 [bacterium]